MVCTVYSRDYAAPRSVHHDCLRAYKVSTILELAFLGFTDYSHGVPVNDKVQHTFGFFAATVVFFFIVDVEESAE